MWQRRPHPPAEFERPFSHATEFWRKFEEISKITTKTARVHTQAAYPCTGVAGKKGSTYFADFASFWSICHLAIRPKWDVANCLIRARCEENSKATKGNQQNQTKWTLPAPNSIDFGAGMVHLEPERSNLEPERNKKAPTKKMSSISLCFKGLKSDTVVGKQPTKK